MDRRDAPPRGVDHVYVINPPEDTFAGMSSGGKGCLGPTANGDSRRFVERRTVPWWWWLVALAIVLPTTEAVVLGPDMSQHPSALLTWGSLAAATALVAGCLRALGRSDVAVDDSGLHAGRVVLPASAIGRARALDPTAAHRLLGPGLRADAHLSLRPWIKTAVQVEVSERDDAAPFCPYWVVATRRPSELVAALDEIARRAPGQALAAEQLAADQLETEQRATEQKASS
ncbi:MAG TPA: DUF3093 domain-containing protein [Acidothermaceae bacterium]